MKSLKKNVELLQNSLSFIPLAKLALPLQEK